MSAVDREPEREALRQIVQKAHEGSWDDGAEYLNSPDAVTDAVIAAGFRREPEPREVTTVAELDALPELSVIRSEQGAIWEAYGEGEFREYLEIGDKRYRDADDIALPATVLFTPEVKP